MTASTDPAHLFMRTPVTRGQLIRLRPPSENDDAANDTLEFHFNPQTVTRTRTGRWEPRKRRSRLIPQEVRGNLGGHGTSALLAESERISLQVTFDATEAILKGDAAAARNGVLPELAFLELSSLGREVEEARAGTPASRDTVPIQPIRADELLLRLGDTRWFPCVLTDLTITEQRYSPTLVPLRAQVDIKLTVLEPVESSLNVLISDAFQHLVQTRSQQMDALGTTTTTSDIRGSLGGQAQP